MVHEQSQYDVWFRSFPATCVQVRNLKRSTAVYIGETIYLPCKLCMKSKCILSLVESDSGGCLEPVCKGV